MLKYSTFDSKTQKPWHKDTKMFPIPCLCSLEKMQNTCCFNASTAVPQKSLGGNGELNKSAAVKSGKLDPNNLCED